MIRMFIISGLFWILALIIYQLILRKFTFHHLNRLYLLSSLVVGCILPFIPIPSGNELPLAINFNPVVIQMNELTAGINNQVIEQTFNYWVIIGIVYSLIVLFHISKLFKGISALVQQTKEASINKRNGIYLVSSTDIKQPFSFLRWIFIPDQGNLDPIILEHEYAHVKGGHSYDKILLQLLAAVYWVLPLFIFYRRFIDEVHEYIADDYVLQKTSKKKYSYFLLGQTGQGVTPLLSNNFHSLIKNRITMILKKESNQYSRLWYIPVMVMMFGLASVILTACEEASNEPATAKELTKNEPMSKMVSLTDTIVTFHPDTYEEEVKYVTNEMEVYNKPDQMPLFSLDGCNGNTSKKELQDCANQNMFQFIFDNIEYPKDKTKEGVVLLKFIVSDEGYAISPEIVKTIGDSYSAAVMGLFNKMADHQWVPGTQNGENKNVFLHLPIKFKLEDK